MLYVSQHHIELLTAIVVRAVRYHVSERPAAYQQEYVIACLELIQMHRNAAIQV